MGMIIDACERSGRAGYKTMISQSIGRHEHSLGQRGTKLRSGSDYRGIEHPRTILTRAGALNLLFHLEQKVQSESLS